MLVKFSVSLFIFLLFLCHSQKYMFLKLNTRSLILSQKVLKFRPLSLKGRLVHAKEIIRNGNKMQSYHQVLHQNTSGEPTTMCINLHELYNFSEHLLEKKTSKCEA